MGTITCSVAETGFATLTKTWTVADSDIDKIVAAYQSGANTSINGTATRTQVLQYWAQSVIAAPTTAAVQAFNTTQPAVPAPISMV